MSDCADNLPRWLTVPEFAEATGMGRRNATRVLSRACQDGKTFGGVELNVRAVPGRGRGGVVYEVAADSLPARDIVQLPAVASSRKRDPGACDEATKKYELIKPALQCRPGSSERGLAVEAAMSVSGKSRRTIYNWIAAHETKGFGSLSRKHRSDGRKSRVLISQSWDRGAREGGLDDAAMAWIAAELEADRNHQWRTRGLRIGWTRIAFDPRDGLRDKLKMLTWEAGWQGDAKTLHRICKVTRKFVERDKKRSRMAAKYERNRKAFNDTEVYHARRDWSKLVPLGWLCIDVHPHDFMLERPDGKTFTCKLVGALDCATGRLRVMPVFLEPGGGVTQQHIAKFMVETMTDPLFGVPSILQFDRGKENLPLHRLNDLLGATYKASTGRDDPEVRHDIPDFPDGFRVWGVTTSLPYNAQAKPIEPAFARLERIVSEHRAYIGGDRMLKPTQNVGRPPVPFKGDKAEFLELLDGWVQTFNSQPFQNSQMPGWNGKSPNQIYNEHVRDGWQPVVATMEEMLPVFHKTDERTIQKASQGTFKFNRKLYKLPEAFGRGSGPVEVMEFPWETDVLGVVDDDGRVHVAKLDAMRDPRDLTGAKEKGRGVRTGNRNVAEARGRAAPIAPERVPDHLVTGADAPLRADVAGSAHVSDDVRELGRLIKVEPKRREADKDDTARETSRAHIEVIRQVRAAGSG